MVGHRWDLFCRVVDNFGDVGVCWRLGRQLATEHGRHLRLWVDRLDTFHRICPAVDPAMATQKLGEVEIRHWGDPWADSDPAEVVIEAFGCELPAAYVEAMARRTFKPVWVNLEYLSAESWVAGCHGLTSPHPRLPLVKHFYFPGFVPGTGGLLRERRLVAERDRFQAAEQADFWAGLGIAPEPGTLKLSLFGYAGPQVPALLDQLALGPASALCLIPEGHSARSAEPFLGGEARPGAQARRGNVSVRIVPFLEQDHFDRLLWACDANLVRGEDSFLRAQWAARPLVWHIYPQEDEAHLAKLDAFLRLYTVGLPDRLARSVREVWTGWSRGDAPPLAWRSFLDAIAPLSAHARRWASGLAAQPDLASRLVEFVDSRV